MSSIPLDFFRLLIDRVNNAHTLFSLLTVNRAIFPIAARALYRDPLWPDLANGDLLIDWLLTLSTADDQDTAMLRQARGLPPPGTNRPFKPLLDYLSFVRGMKWEQARFWSSWSSWSFPKGHFTAQDRDGEQGSPCAVFIRTTLSWAVFSSNLENIRHLYVESNDIDRYIAAADRLRSVTTIYVNVQAYYQDACNMAICLVEAIQRHHGRNSKLCDCRFSANVFSPEYRYTGDYNVTSMLKLYSLLPAPVVPLRIPRTDGSVVVLDRPFDRDLAELEREEVIATKVLHQYYSNLSRGLIMQRLRSITKILETLTYENMDMFEWAADEAQYRLSPPALPMWMPPPVPVQSLELTTSSKDPPRDLQAIQDALHGFAGTLKVLQITLLSDRNLWQIPEILSPMPYLQYLTISTQAAIFIHPSLWESVPRLETLYVSHYSRYARPFGNDHSSPSLCWPVITSMPKLRSLVLRSEASRLFHPESLHHMPKLERLVIAALQGSLPRPWGISLEERWRCTWNWSLPYLTEVNLELDIVMVGLDLCRLLQTCPRLERIQIRDCASHRNFQPLVIQSSCPPLGSSVGDNSRFPNVQVLDINGQWSVEMNQLSYLYNHMLPGLTLLSFGLGVKFVDWSDIGFVNATRMHPSCRTIRVSQKRTSSLQVLGLVDYSDRGALSYTFENGSWYHNF